MIPRRLKTSYYDFYIYLASNIEEVQNFTNNNIVYEYKIIIFNLQKK